jgi:hypothetical protein
MTFFVASIVLCLIAHGSTLSVMPPSTLARKRSGRFSQSLNAKMDFLKATPEQLAKYIDFLTTFGRSPRQALASVSTASAVIAHKVSPQLLLYALLSVGLATLINVIGAAVGMAPDSSAIVAVVSRVDDKWRPFAAAALIVIAAVVWHGLARAVGWLLARISNAQPFRGDVAGSINASLAITVWFLPIFVAVIVAIRIIALRSTFSLLLFLIAVVPLALAFPVYFVLAFAAVHGVSLGEAAVLFGFTTLVLTYVSEYFAS